MCGLTAVLAPRASRASLERLIVGLTGRLSHRGPDHRAHAVHGAVALGHTRLRVVDRRPEADQPMSFEGAHLVFSGAIANHRDLRTELRRDHQVAFRTSSDTEVLLHALRVWGEAALERVEGMFAFVFHDARRARVLAARDRVGIEPLVWTRRADGALLFASEAQALLRSEGVARGVDRLALGQLLRFNHPLGDRTFFEGIFALEPGCMLSADVERAEPAIRRWWTLRMIPSRVDLGSAVRDLDVRFQAAIRRAVDVDVPHGAYLSGGVDSSGIAAELLRQGHAPRLYSLVLPGVPYSEEGRIDDFVASARVRTEKVAVSGLTLGDLVEYATRAEMPQWWTSDLALAVLARRARQDGTSVVLSGEGPDELFAGYEVYRVAPFRPLLVRAGALVGPSSLGASVVRRIVPWLDVDTSVARAWLASHDPSRAAHVADHYGFHPENLPLWESLEARRPLAGRGFDDRNARAVERTYFREQLAPRMAGLGALERNLYFEIGERLPRWILHMGDRMSSTHGVELRFPYLDDAFVEAALRLPMSLRSTVLEDKRVLRRMHRHRLPRAVARRRKQPLYTPTGRWLGPVLADPSLERYWSRASFERAGLLDFEVCDAARARLAANHKPDAMTAMVDEWLFTFALTTAIVAVELLGA
jgi:asparagine synthase (glutamine-hydrolysing)